MSRSRRRLAGDIGVAATVVPAPTVRPATLAVKAFIARTATPGIERMMDGFKAGSYGARVTVPAPKATRRPATASSSESVRALIILSFLVATFPYCEFPYCELYWDDRKGMPHATCLPITVRRPNQE